MQSLDGNAIGGDLFEFFGTEMTTARGACAHCGAVSLIADLAVYKQAPGAVVRCRGCDNEVIVLVRIRQDLRIALDGFALRDS
jgi:hypothetical protein